MSDIYLQSLECFCVKGVSTTCPAGGTLDATIQVDHSVASTMETASSLISDATRARCTDADIVSSSSIISKLSAIFSLEETVLESNPDLIEDLTAEYCLNQLLESTADLGNTVDKIVGDFQSWECVQKLYPSGDGPVADGFSQFVGPPVYGNLFEQPDLWSYINEGVYQGSSVDGGDSILISDDNVSFIRPSAQVHTEGFFQYNALLTDFLVRPEESRLRMRISAPVENIESKTPPLYTIYDIKFQDPSGNVLVRYEDFSFRGDATEEWDNWTTFSLKPTYNVFNTYDWDRRTFPYINETQDYSLVFSLQAISLDDPFDEGFNLGFEENYIVPQVLIVGDDNYLSIGGTPTSTQAHYINPTEHFKLSAIEICNSGGYGPRIEDYFAVYMGVDEVGKRLERKIYPSFTPIATDYPVDVYPYASGLWSSVTGDTNEDVCGARSIIGSIKSNNTLSYISLDSIHGGPADSGKLVVKFSSGPSDVTEITKGAFNFEFDQSSNKRWWSPSGAFNTENDRNINQRDDIFFDVESITLEVVAKKPAGARDFVLDVVGWSDDKLLNVTAASGGFIQDPSGGICLNNILIGQQGQHPVLSGINNVELPLSEQSLSEMEGYYESSGNDHHKLTQYPWVTGTDFELYEVPLKIIDEQVQLGVGRDYSISTLFEHLYLDIYPLPSGASIAHMAINVRYRPQNALNLSALGGDIIAPLIPDGRSEGALYPNIMGSVDDILNAGSGYAPLSAISGVPHRFSSPSTLKSNYARRWRGVEGTVRGPYDPSPFSFAFENPVMDYPFVSGYYKFENIDGSYVTSSLLGEGFGNTSGLFSAAPTVYHNVGWRYIIDNGDGLFQTQLPGYTGINKTSDWTSLSDGVTDFTDDVMYGKIADAFDRITRISQHTQNITFSDVDVASEGFSFFLRYTPDVTVSGVGYDLFNSGVLVSRWQTPSELDFALGLYNGRLRVYAKDDVGNPVSVIDSIDFDEYTYPLNVLVTYSDDKRLRLYTDNESADISWDVLRGTSVVFDRNVIDADIVLGWSEGSGVGMNMLVSEFAISSGNIVESNPDLTLKQVTAEKFLENSRVKYFDPNESYENDRYKLWDRVNEDTYNDWRIGAFKYCEFGVAFDQLQLRPNKEMITFEYCCDGTPYFAKTTKALPGFVNADKKSVAYHTQIENDFLRFHLSDVPNSFYSVQRRITKNIPRGYSFAEDAMVVESVIQHSYSGALNVWNEDTCLEKIGPKLIVSLYAKSKESYWEDPNPYGLVNRKVHYIEPSSCIMRIDSTFSYEDICEEEEDWALFDNEPLLDEFGEKYFTDDVNQMFVQYDLVYPTGLPFSSRLELHSSHVRMVDANISPVNSSGSLPLMASGAFSQTDVLPLYTKIELGLESGIVPLSIQTPLYAASGLTLRVSGDYRINDSMPLFITDLISSTGNLPLRTLGGLSTPFSGIMNLAMPNTLAYLNSSLPLYTFSKGTPTSGNMSLYTYAYANSGIRDSVNLYMQTAVGAGTFLAKSGTMSLTTFGTPAVVDTFGESSVNLYVFGEGQPSEKLNLYLSSYRNPADSSGVMNLYTATFSSDPGITGKTSVTWNGQNYGKGIDIDDNIYATVPVYNEIRGVDLTGYGSCSSDSPSKAIDQPLITDCTVWREAICNEGGAFRAKATYSNSGALGFDGITLGYDKNYYGIRKIDSLLPGYAYDTVVTIKTGNTDPIPVPRNFEEWEYGKCGPAWNATDGLCSNGCEQNIVDSGIKLIADDGRGVPPSGDGFIDPLFIVQSGRGDGYNYGASVSVQNDLMLVGSPNMVLPDIGGIESSGAGGVFIYKRLEDVAGKKAYWDFETLLALPSGYRKDYVDSIQEDYLVFEDLSIDARQWAIGQEGRGFGTSVDLASSGDRQVAVVGASKASWSREFEQLDTSGVKVAAVVVSDRFNWPSNKSAVKALRQSATYYDLLYKYFSAPWYAESIYGGNPNEFQPAIDLRLIVLQPADFSQPLPEAPALDQDESWITHKFIPRLDDNYRNSYSPAHIRDEISSGFYSAFFTQFPSGLAARNSQIVYSGVPAFLTLFEDNSDSVLGGVIDNNFNLFDNIQDFFNAYTFESGVFDQIEEKPESGVISFIQENGDNWESITNQSIQDLLDTGNLLNTSNNYGNPNLTFITSGVGQIWNKTNANQFNLPPSSGGRAYVFEKERETWNCVQVITSPNDVSQESDNDSIAGGEILPYQWPDRFGHSVGISKNGEVVSVGSPFTTSPCRIYERSQTEINRLFNGLRSWLVINKPSAVALYDSLLSSQGEVAAKDGAYDSLSDSERFAFRNDEDFWGGFDKIPQQYKWTFEYTYQDIQYTGTNSFLAGAFAPSSRLGWSTSVDEDGDNVAFGAPTDSFNEFEDVNVWGTGLKTWASYNYAGAVRMFNSRKFYSHSGVVEFGRFGNLDRSQHPEERDAGYYDQWNSIFDPDVNPWRRMAFSEIEIPRDAGLAFIMTPELDAASDEIIQNIKDWLALGDRNLVLVGNDPVWEENGLYEPSNEIVNKILQRLGVDMRIFAAEKEALSLQECIVVNEENQNITKSLTPKYSSGPTLATNNYFASGVGDIKIDISKYNLQNYTDKMNCPEGKLPEPRVINERCEMPHGQYGDLRAQWVEECSKENSNGNNIQVRYTRSWPFEYGNFNTGCDPEPKTVIKRQGLDPIPVLTTREYIPEQVITSPTTSGKILNYIEIKEWVVYEVGETSYNFADSQLDYVQFGINEDENSEPEGDFTSYVQGGFFDPDSLNGRDSLIQATGTAITNQEVAPYFEEIYPNAIIGLVESGRKVSDGTHNNSKIYLFASQWSEDDASRGLQGNQNTGNNDKNTLFYLNLIQKDCSTIPVGQHLGGFTGRLSLEDAYFQDSSPPGGSNQAGHTLASKINSVTFDSFTEGVEYIGSANISNSVDYVWIAHPAGKASDQDIARINRWMDGGDKKLIITYNSMRKNNVQDIAENVADLCERLGMTSGPVFDPVNQLYSVVDSKSAYDKLPPFSIQDIIDSWSYQKETAGSNLQVVNTDADAFFGCPAGYSYSNIYNSNTEVPGLWFSDESTLLYSTREGELGAERGIDRVRFVPISGGIDYEEIASFNYPITEIRYNTENVTQWTMDVAGNIELSNQAFVGSGYRVFMNYVTEKPTDKFDICGEFKGHSFDPDPGDGGFGGGLGGDSYQDKCQFKFERDRGNDRNILTVTKDIRVNGNLGLQLFTPYKFIDPSEIDAGVIPQSVRFLSMSGCPLEIEENVSTVRNSGLVVVDVRVEESWVTFPGSSYTVPGYYRPTSELSSRYCTESSSFDLSSDCNELGKSIIENGPVVVAEQPETFSSFPAGNNRSRIIVISDSTMLQGQCPNYRSTQDGNVAFIKSLYPESPEESNSGDGNKPSSEGQRWWTFVQKIRAPERGSAAKYYAASGYALNNNMISPLYTLLGIEGNLIDFTDLEDTFDPRVVSRPQEITDPIAIAQATADFAEQCVTERGMLPLFSGDYLHLGDYDPYLYPLNPDKDQDVIFDAKIKGGLPDLMKVNGKDYLDIEFYYERSGCLGDLFGYSIDLTNNKLIVGSPFNAFYSEVNSGVVSWGDVRRTYDYDGVASGLDLAEDGGAGAAFVFNKTNQGSNVVVENLPWEFEAKIKPSGANAGITDWGRSGGSTIDDLIYFKGQTSYEDIFNAKRYGSRSDNFGFSVAIDCDMLLVGAPNHDFETLHDYKYSGVVDPNGLNSAFLRKSFDAAFDIPLHEYYDLGFSGTRQLPGFTNSGQFILNAGAVFNYRYEMTDIGARQQEWVYAQKLFSEGYSSRFEAEYNGIPSPGEFFPPLTASGAELDNFGFAVAIDRAYRGDADYTAVIGSPNHSFATSGDHPTQRVPQAGAANSFDAMLRGQVDATANSGGWMDVKVYSDIREADKTLFTRVNQNKDGGSITYQVSGILNSNGEGEVFLEVSGYDPSAVGYIAHRPYVHSIQLTIDQNAPSINETMPLAMLGGPQVKSDNLPLFILGPDSANVYNNMNNYVFGAYPDSGTMKLEIIGQDVESGVLPLRVKSPEASTDYLSFKLRGF